LHKTEEEFHGDGAQESSRCLQKSLGSDRPEG